MIAGLLNTFPDAQTQAVWSFDHMDQHNKIINSVFQQQGIDLEPFILDPMPPVGTPELTNWLETHQASSTAYEDLLGISGQDYTDVDFTREDQASSWLRLHYESHRQAQQKLGFPD